MSPTAPWAGAPRGGPHSASVLDMVDASIRLLSTETGSADLAGFVHHQAWHKFDVLRSDENDERHHKVTGEEVEIAHRMVSRFYRLTVMDSGNTARSANWRSMMDHTDQLVVPVTAMEDQAEAARLTLQTLESRGGHDADLARNAVAIVSESTDTGRGLGGLALRRARDEAARSTEGFASLVRPVVRVPYDPALARGLIRYDGLAAAAVVAQGVLKPLPGQSGTKPLSSWRRSSARRPRGRRRVRRPSAGPRRRGRWPSRTAPRASGRPARPSNPSHRRG
jgi:hypothetical protein